MTLEEYNKLVVGDIIWLQDGDWKYQITITHFEMEDGLIEDEDGDIQIPTLRGHTIALETPDTYRNIYKPGHDFGECTFEPVREYNSWGYIDLSVDEFLWNIYRTGQFDKNRLLAYLTETT